MSGEDMVQADSTDAEMAEKSGEQFSFGTWYPIESAPKDGSRFLAALRSMRRKPFEPHEYRLVIARWHVPTGIMNERKHVLDMRHNGYWTSHHKGTQPLDCLPVAWMPKPPPPPVSVTAPTNPRATLSNEKSYPLEATHDD